MQFYRKLILPLCVSAILSSCILPAYAVPDHFAPDVEIVTEEAAVETRPVEIVQPAGTTEPTETKPEQTLPDQTSDERTVMWTTDGFPLFNQLDYPNKRFGTGTVATSGCSITSLAMVATYLTGHTYFPDELAGYFGSHGENNVQRLEYAAQQLKLPMRKAYNIRQVFGAMKKGSVAILLMNQNSIFADSQHFIVLYSITDDGKFMVADAYGLNYEKETLKLGFEEGFTEKELIQGYNGGWIFDVSAMPKNPFIYTEKNPDCEPRYPGVELTWDEQQLMAKLIWLEARGESQKGQQAVAEVVLNRLVSGKFGASIQEVICGEGQFRTTPLLKDAQAWQAQYEAIDNALSGPNVLPMSVYYFSTKPESDRIWGKIGEHYFFYD